MASIVTDYTNLLRSNGQFLAFGFLMMFLSSAGQTYYIGIFGPQIQDTFDLSHTHWSSIYMIGTLASAALLPWTGQLIDTFKLRTYAFLALLGLVVACLAMSWTNSTLMLVLTIFLLRQFGQGLTSHASQTSMARYMGKHRGKSLALASTGFSFGEAILPVGAVVAIALFGWRFSYQLTALWVLLFIPVILWTLRGQQTRHQNHEKEQRLVEQQEALSNSGQLSKTRKQMLREGRFYLVLFAVLVPSYIATALFFYHLSIAESKSWSALWITSNYWLYALVTVVTSLLAGPMIDKYTAARVIPYYLAPLIAAMLVLIPGDHAFWVVPYMILLGTNIGLYFTATPALWAELYGPKHLGGIKSTIGAFNVFASALGPVTIGTMLDAGYNFDQIFVTLAGICVAASVLLVFGLRRYE